MNVHGFWSKANAKNRTDRSRLASGPTPPPGRKSAEEFPERDISNAPTTAGCPVHRMTR